MKKEIHIDSDKKVLPVILMAAGALLAAALLAEALALAAELAADELAPDEDAACMLETCISARYASHCGTAHTPTSTHVPTTVKVTHIAMSMLYSADFTAGWLLPKGPTEQGTMTQMSRLRYSIANMKTHFSS